MGNAIGRRRKAKVMKVDGETFKLKTPARASDAVKDYPGYVLFDSEAVKNFGLGAKPLEPQQELKPKKIYFLVELPKVAAVSDQQEKLTRRVRSNGLHVSAKDKLELLMMSKRSVSDISGARPISDMVVSGPDGPRSGPLTVKMRLPKAQLNKLVEESRDQTELMGNIMKIYSSGGGNSSGNSTVASGSNTPADGHSGVLVHSDARWMLDGNGNRKGHKTREKRVSFFAAQEKETPGDADQ